MFVYENRISIIIILSYYNEHYLANIALKLEVRFIPRTHKQSSHNPSVMDRPPLPPPILICCNISKRFCLAWKAFDLISKMRYILWVVALLEVYDVTKRGCHLGFSQELEVR